MVNPHSIFGGLNTNSNSIHATGNGEINGDIQSGNESPANNSDGDFSDFGGGPFEPGSLQHK